MTKERKVDSIVDQKQGKGCDVEMNEAIKIIERINDWLSEGYFHISEEGGQMFLLTLYTDGNCFGIEFVGTPIWDSENDGREMIPNDRSRPKEYGNDPEMHEALETFLIRWVKERLRVFGRLHSLMVTQ